MNTSNKNIYVDLHQDVVSHLRSRMKPQVDLKSLASRANIIFGSVFVESRKASVQSGKDLKQIEKDILWYRNLRKNRIAPYETIRTSKDVARTFQKKGRALIIHLEGADTITPETENKIDEWYKLGLCSVGLVWNRDNAIATAAASNRPKQGLSEFGKKFIRHLNELGMIIDCSHLNEAGFSDVLRLATRPPIVTHGNARALAPHPRNFTDRQIKQLVKAGGIIGVFFSAKYVRHDRPPTVKDVVRHIRHIADIGGIDSVAIGSDFGGITSGLVSGLAHINDLPKLESELVASGFSSSDIKKIFGLNAIRYLKSVL